MLVDGSVAGWREEARRLLLSGVPPEGVDWCEPGSGAQGSLLAAGAFPAGTPVGPERGPLPAGALHPAPPVVPRRFLAAVETAACHRDPQRWSLFYRLLWRLTHGEPHLLELATDGDVRAFERLRKEVRRDAHKMKAFVRFRRVTDADGERWVAWHNPDHAIVRLVAPFFAERFGDMRWAILTPAGSVRKDGDGLLFGPAVPFPGAVDDADAEDLWRAYYASTYNPARLNLRLMKRELPVRHWATLPETRVVSDLVRRSASQVAGMVERETAEVAAAELPGGAGPATIAAALPGCRACPLWRTATRPVAGEGPPDAAIVLVGEQPGDREDRLGRPFVGPAGELLDELIERAGLDRRELYLTNAVKHFKFEERGKQRIHKTPAPVEVSSCFPWLAAELAAVRPRVLVCLGATAARALLGPEVRVRRDRGQPLPTRWAPWATVTWHPSALLRLPEEARPQAQAELVADLRAAASASS